MMRTLVLPFFARCWRQGLLADGWLQRAGDLLQRRQDVIRRVQWSFVGFYYFLLIVPAILPQPVNRAGILSSLAGWAEIIFWGVWWPGVILSMMLFGQFWCGVFCPDGTVTEWASRHGRGGKIPAWVRWSGWPILAFSVVVVYEHLSNAYQAPRAILLSVGGASLLALVCGYFLGRGKRIWCRYLCPASSLFSLLARCAIFYFKVDRRAWDAAPKPLPRAVDCPPLLDVRRLRSNEKCSMCGRCSGHRNAVALAMRAPGSEIVNMTEDEIRSSDAIGVCGVLIGLGYGAVYGRDGWLGGLLGNATPGVAGSLWFPLLGILLTALILSLVTGVMLYGAARGNGKAANHLAYSLIPLAGCGLFLGALEHAFQMLGEMDVAIGSWAVWVRMGVVLAGSAWSGILGWKIIRRWFGEAMLFSAGVQSLLIVGLAVLFVRTP